MVARLARASEHRRGAAEQTLIHKYAQRLPRRERRDAASLEARHGLSFLRRSQPCIAAGLETMLHCRHAAAITTACENEDRIAINHGDQ